MNVRPLMLASIVLVGCKAAETPQQMATREQAEADSARTAITEGNTRWARYANASQLDSIAGMYTPEGVMMPPDVPGATGRDSIIARLRPLVIPGGTLTITNQNVSLHGPVAVDRGVFTYAVPAQGGNPAVTVRGKYLAHWHKMDGGWRIAENIWNNDAPAPPPPPARR